MNKTVVGVVVVAIIVIFGGGIFLASRQKSQPTEISPPTQRTTTSTTGESTFQPGTFENIKTPHFVSSNPENNAVLTKGPSQVTINFNFNLVAGSAIQVLANENDVVAQPAKISADKLSMTALINPVEPANYKVNYTACWPDGSCHNGSFGFTVKLP